MPASNIVSVAMPVANTEVQVLGPNPRRTRVILAFGQTSGAWYRNDPQGATAGGLWVSASSDGVELTIDDHGDIVTKPWFVMSTTGANAVASVLETIA